MRRNIVAIGDDAAIELTPVELRALGLKVGDKVDVRFASGVLEVTPVDQYSDLGIDELLQLVDSRS